VSGVAGSDPSSTMIRISLPVRLRRAGIDSVVTRRLASNGTLLQCTEAIMIAHGFTVPLLADLIRAEYATACEFVVALAGVALSIRRL
jgi:hypothetical protein